MAGKPPFGEGKKKHEFPDAFTAQVLSNWSRETRPTELEIYASTLTLPIDVATARRKI